MKIEKVNDQQIRCTLTKSDLADRELKISELAYGTEKAKNLFRDMMQQASYEFGFDAEDIPLMIEAIPLNSECIVLIITKVEDPEELDTRFSKFAPSVHDNDASDNEINDTIHSISEGADDVLDLFKKIHQGKFANILEDEQEENTDVERSSKSKKARLLAPASITADIDLTKLYSFDSLETLSRVSLILSDFYTGINTLYKNNDSGKYTLVVSKSSHTPEQFNKICNILSEYGLSEKFASASGAYLEEHFEPLLKDNALQALATL